MTEPQAPIVPNTNVVAGTEPQSTEPTPTTTDFPNTSTPPSNLNQITLRSPRKYNHPAPSDWAVPTLEWIQGTWSVTHSTLQMWRKAKNVRITYTILPGKFPGEERLDDLVESEVLEKSWMPQPGRIEGVDKGDGEAAWFWRGKGWLRITSSRWEVLGWGEDEGGERWIVTWFAPSMFTPMGVDFYSSRREGMSEGLRGRLVEKLEAVEAKEVVDLVKSQMREVKIEL